ncbi:MAG: GAF domain-containing protein [Pirellulaceae bacterium]|nr:GAF domain-containing protein [Pirellulaceae bacterium]
MLLVKLVLVSATLVQLAVAAVALRMIWLTGRKWAWSLLVLAVLLMIARRSVPLFRIVAGDPTFSSDLAFELVGLTISVVLLASLLGMWPIFAALQRSADTLRAQRQRLETLLNLERTAEADADAGQLAELALREGASLTRSRLAYLAMLNEDESLQAWYGWREQPNETRASDQKALAETWVQNGMWREAVRQRRLVTVNDVVVAGGSRFRNCLHMPVLDGDRIVAVVGMVDKPRAYDESDVPHLSVLMQSVCRLIQRQQTARRSERLTAVISAIRNVNQLISREKDVPRLLEAACRAMVQGGAYRGVWIGRLDDSLRLVDHQQAGTDGRFDSVVLPGREGRWSDQGRELLAQNRVATVPRAASLVLGARSEGGASHPALATRLEYRDCVYGLMIAEPATELAIDAQEESLVLELAGDLGLALYSLEIDDQRQLAEQSLRLERSRLEALLQLGQMTDATLQQITDFALEEAVRLTQSEIGYLAFTTEDESVLIMHSWSKTAMKECAIINKPIEYPVVTTGLWGEAVRQRQPVITNDYAAPSPWKKGYPTGHVTVRRHMNVPIFEGDRIVAVSGVGNKTEPYDESDVRQLTLLAQGMWRLIQRKRADEALREARDELELRVDQRTAELRSANEELQHERYLLHTLMDHLPHAIYFKDSNSRFLRINRAMGAMFGLADPAEAIGMSDRDFFAAEHAERAMADERRIVQTGEPVVDLQEKETWPDGRVTWALTTKMPLLDESGRIIGTFGLSRDITEQKQTAEALQAAKEAAEAANRAKSSFLANMSHEIRTPLNAVIGMSELLLDTQVTPQQHEFLTIVKDSGEALLSVINDILDFSKIEAGKLTLERAPFDLWEQVGDTMKSFATRANQRELELACRIHPDVPRLAIGDANRLRQIIINLVGNALKFTDRGEVVLDVQRESRNADDVVLHFTVRDTGIGIPKNRQAAIFEMFEQADSSSTRRYGGTGLGLTICQRLTELMGGRIWLESEPGVGSSFHFTVHLEIGCEALAHRPRAELAGIHGLQVLVVDDNTTNRRILDEVLRSWQFLPVLVSSAEEAWEELQRAKVVGQPYPLMLTDVHMPGTDGFALVERIKSDPLSRGPAIVMLTSGDHPEDLGRCQDLGISAYLIKPAKQSELFEAILVALGVARIDESVKPAPEPPEPGCRPLKILLAEDSLVNQKLAVSLLERQGHDVTVVNDGRKAVEALEAESFDLVLMDVQMPEMDGLEATRQIRLREQSLQRHTPIIAMTAYALKGDRERCLAAGMDGYVSKPVRPKALAETINAILPAMDQPLPAQA